MQALDGSNLPLVPCIFNGPHRFVVWPLWPKNELTCQLEAMLEVCNMI